MRATGLIEPLPTSLQHLYLPEHIFTQRFEVIHEIEDPYVRLYEISRDEETGGRVAVRSYTALEGSQEHDVLESMVIDMQIWRAFGNWVMRRACADYWPSPRNSKEESSRLPSSIVTSVSRNS
jgi:hypothetical protein